MKKILFSLALLLSLGSTLCIEQAAAAQGIRLIRNETDWIAFRNAVEEADGEYSVDARLEADFSTDKGIGLDEYTPYRGTFDGNGHTITATNIWRDDGKPCALFCYAKDATIKNLHVKGTITGGIHSAGLIGKVLGSSTVTVNRVWVSTEVNASSATHAGGIIGHSDYARVYMNDCRFDGKVNTNNSDDSYAGDIIGWCNGGGWNLKRVYDQGSPKAHYMYFCIDYNSSSVSWKNWGTNGNSFTVTHHNWNTVNYYNKTSQREVVSLMNDEKADSWEMVDGKAVPKMKQPSLDGWNILSEGSSSGKTLYSGHFYVSEDVTFSNGATGSGLTISDGATVYLYIPKGVTLTARGGNASGRTGAGAGIELPAGSTLYLMGKGKVEAYGGNAANGETGGTGDDARGGNGSWTHTGAGGSGGNGGGGAGAGIGTRGGAGGSGGSGGAGYKYDDGAEDDAENGTNGSAGEAGSTAGAMGNLYVVASSVDLNATGGNAGTSGGSGGQRGRGYAYDGYSYNVTVAGGGGGGGGGFGGAAFPIGTGGCGGGGGGGGAGGAQDFRSNSKGGVYDVTAPGGSGGKNADGHTSGDTGTEAATNGTAHSNSWVTVENGSFNSGSDWNSASGACSFGSGGNGGDRGGASDGMSVKDLHEYRLTFNVTGATPKSVRIDYWSNKSGASIPFTIPTTYQLGLIESDKYVSKWYTSSSLTGTPLAAYDETSIGTDTNLYGAWQDYGGEDGIFPNGSGTKSDPYIINASNLIKFVNYVNDGGNTRGLYFKQQGEFDVAAITNDKSDYNWTPIGYKRVFEGDYDGDNNRIINARNTNLNVSSFGIFGDVSGSIHNLGVEDCNFQSNSSYTTLAGAIAGRLLRCDIEQSTRAQIHNCYAANNTITAEFVGGLVGSMSDASSISYCLETRSTLNTNLVDFPAGFNIGGIVSIIREDCQVDKCFTSGSLSSDGYYQATNSEANVSYDRLKSGEIAWLLNDQSSHGGPWLQTIDTDLYPVFDTDHAHVYKDGENYTNTPSGDLFDNFSGKGTGTAEDPFLINNAADLQKVYMYCSINHINLAGMHFLQTADIDLNGGAWIPVGNNNYPFGGIYDGGGHTIRNFNMSGYSFGGIFGVVTGTVTRLAVESTTVTGTGDARVGAIAGRVRGNGVISNCFVKGCTISADANNGVAGGIAGDLYDDAVISNCLTSIYDNTNTAKTVTGKSAGYICGEMMDATMLSLCYTNGASLVGYQDFQCTVSDSRPLDASNLASGEYAYILNNRPQKDNLSPVWYQNLTISESDPRVPDLIDLTPVLSADHAMVFKRGDNYTNDYGGISSLGKGSESNPYEVGSAADLKKISDTFETMRYSNFHILQTADIDMKEAASIAPIGIGTSGFTGHYNGGGHVISNLSITDCNGITNGVSNYKDESLGLFNNIIGTVERLGIENGTFKAADGINRVGAFAGKITGSGKLLNCFAAGCTVDYNFKTNAVVGALVGELTDQSRIEGSYGYLNTVLGKVDEGNKQYGYIVGNIGSEAAATRIYTTGPTLCADGQSGYDNITDFETDVAASRFQTGELAYLLEGMKDEYVIESPNTQAVIDTKGTSIWGQKIKTDPYPIPSTSNPHKPIFKYGYLTQTMYANTNDVPEMVVLSLDPNYQDDQGKDMPAVPVAVFKADDRYYVPGYNLDNSSATRNHYYLAGWNTQADGNGTHYATNGVVPAPGESTTVYAEWDVMVPISGTFTATLPEGKTSIKIYDGGGYNSPYGNNYSGKLTLKAPDNTHVIYLTGTVATEALVDGQPSDYMIVRDGDDTSDPMSNGQSKEVKINDKDVPVFVSDADGVAKSIGRLFSTGNEITIEFYTSEGTNFNGLNLTATLISSNINKMGLGTAENPFKVEFVEDLETIQDYMKMTGNTNIYIQQVEDIDLEGKAIAPLGNPGFAGHYDGCGYVIKNGTISAPTYAGVFGVVRGTVTRLGVEDMTINYDSINGRSGGIAARLSGNGEISNCYVKNCTVKNNGIQGYYGQGVSGAIVADMFDQSVIRNCFTFGNTLTATRTAHICSDTKSGTSISRCYTDGDNLFSEAGATVTNCSTNMSADQFDSGEICYLLNASSTADDVVWRQTIGTDSLPVPDSKSPVVYYQTKDYNEQNYTGYTNEATADVAALRVQDVPFDTTTDHIAIKGSLVRLADYVPVHDNLQFIKWNTLADFTGTDYAQDANLVLSELTVLYPLWDKMPTVLPGEGTEQSPYIIDSTEDWNALATNIAYFNLFNGYANKVIRLDADIDVTKIMGTMSAQTTQGNAFCGTFNGNNHSITATIFDTEHQGTAPFCYIKDATIKNLIVNGTVTAGNMQHAAGLVGFAAGTSKIKNCKVTANVIGGTHIGGILGHSLNSNVTISGCLFSGTMTGGATAKGAIIGWGDHGSMTVTNCIYLMSSNQVTDALDVIRKSGGYDGVITVNNTYKTTSVGSYGVQASVNPVEPIESEMSQKLLTLYGCTMYALTPCTVSGIDANYDMRTAAVSITPTVTSPNSMALSYGNDFTATLNGDAVTQIPIAIDEVGDYTLVLTGAGDYAGSKTYRFHVEGDHVFITLGQEVGTYSYGEDLDFTGSNLKAYIAAGYNKGLNQVLLVRVYDVPAGTGLFLKGEPGVKYNIPKTTSQSYYVNMFKPNLTAGPVAQTEGSMSNFLLAKPGAYFMFCAPTTDATLGANRAYLQVPTSFISNNAREVKIVFEDDNATGISDASGLNEDGKFYDLQGRLVYGPSSKDNGKLKKGLYITNGKKVVVK